MSDSSSSANQDRLEQVLAEYLRAIEAGQWNRHRADTIGTHGMRAARPAFRSLTALARPGRGQLAAQFASVDCVGALVLPSCTDRAPHLDVV